MGNGELTIMVEISPIKLISLIKFFITPEATGSSLGLPRTSVKLKSKTSDIILIL